MWSEELWRLIFEDLLQISGAAIAYCLLPIASPASSEPELKKDCRLSTTAFLS